MAWTDFLADIFTPRELHADTHPSGSQQVDEAEIEPSSTAEQSGATTVKGGASTKGTPASGPTQESGEEADVNEEDAKKAAARGGDEGAEEEGPSDDVARGDVDAVLAAPGGGDEEEAEGVEEEAEEEEEEEDEPEDPAPRLRQECADSRECAPLKHHYEACSERVQAALDAPSKKGPKEDCVEEYFHLMHCATQCAAPKLFRQLR